MRYILLAAGIGKRLHPLTKKYPKCLYKLNENMTIAQMTINNIRLFDPSAEIVVVTGFMGRLIENTIKNVLFIYNPFFACTNSIASLWFARNFLTGHVTIVNADVVADRNLMEEIITQELDYPCVLIDSSIKKDGDYNVQVKGEYVVVMSKELQDYYGEYAGITKLEPRSASLLKDEIERMLEEGSYDQWYESALVQLVFNSNFRLRYKDISDYNWTEVDCVDDLLKAKEIYFHDTTSAKGPEQTD